MLQWPDEKRLGQVLYSLRGYYVYCKVHCELSILDIGINFTENCQRTGFRYLPVSQGWWEADSRKENRITIYRDLSRIRTHGLHWSMFLMTTVCNIFCNDCFIDEKSDTNSSVNNQGDKWQRVQDPGFPPVVLCLEEKERVALRKSRQTWILRK